jgi:hypothetical protein
MSHSVYQFRLRVMRMNRCAEAWGFPSLGIPNLN